jgi:hypothetical protein
MEFDLIALCVLTVGALVTGIMIGRGRRKDKHDELMDKLIDKAIAYAEQVDKKTVKQTGEKSNNNVIVLDTTEPKKRHTWKMSLAVDFVQLEFEEYGIPNIPHNRLIRLIEAKLGESTKMYNDGNEYTDE